jgi:hypothetical protein
MPQRVAEPRERFAWGLVWVLFILVGLIGAAAYYGWYRPTYEGHIHGPLHSQKVSRVVVFR